MIEGHERRKNERRGEKERVFRLILLLLLYVYRRNKSASRLYVVENAQIQVCNR